MLFNTPIFFFFLVAFLVLYGFVFLKRRPRVYFILVSSLIFYAGWNYRFIPLLVGSAVVDYYVALQIAAAQTKERKKRWLAVSIATNLGVLAVFKYADFAMRSMTDLFQAVGVDMSLPHLAWVLPVGISFYTFQSMSYTIDVYRGHFEPRRGLVEFTAALSFFPQLVAGPILRASHILPQFHKLPTPTWNQAKHAFLLITVGLMKKTTADLLAVPAATVFESPDSVSLLESWTGVLAFAGQIYGDFSGYSDMAIGLALLLGFEIPLNFRLPYVARSIIDFWRRWHISLSTWLRDYLYISLGGNRTGHRYRNLFITMALGGLWHGAAWTFVAWGVFHGVLLMVHHALADHPAFRVFKDGHSRAIRFVRWAFTFYLVLLGWVLFRATDLASAGRILVDLHTWMPGGLPAAGSSAAVIAGLTVGALVLMHAIDAYVLNRADRLIQRPWLFWILLVIGQALCLLVGEPSSEFIYFQF